MLTETVDTQHLKYKPVFRLLTYDSEEQPSIALAITTLHFKSIHLNARAYSYRDLERFAGC